MLRMHLEAKKRCYNHPHRLSEATCERCKLTLCAECIVEYEGARFCANCQRELADAKALKPTFRDQVREQVRSFTTGLIVLAVLGVLVGGVFLFFRPHFDRPLTPEELARFRYAIAGTFETPDGVNVTSTLLEAKIVGVTSEAEGYPATNLINEYALDGWPGWRSANADLPQEIVVQTGNPSAIEKVILTNHPTEPVASYVKEFEVLVSTEGPDRGFSSVGRWAMEPNAEAQTFTFPKTMATYIKLRILSRQGDSPYTSLAEFNAFVVPEKPFATGSATPSPDELK